MKEIIFITFSYFCFRLNYSLFKLTTNFSFSFKIKYVELTSQNLDRKALPSGLESLTFDSRSCVLRSKVRSQNFIINIYCQSLLKSNIRLHVFPWSRVFALFYYNTEFCNYENSYSQTAKGIKLKYMISTTNYYNFVFHFKFFCFNLNSLRASPQ
jgi:hypothetical protein